MVSPIAAPITVIPKSDMQTLETIPSRSVKRYNEKFVLPFRPYPLDFIDIDVSMAFSNDHESIAVKIRMDV